MSLFLPGSVLRTHVETYWTESIAAALEGSVDLIFDRARRDVFVGGTVPASAEIFGVRFSPSAAEQLLGVTPPAQTKRLEDLIGPSATGLAELVFSAQSDRDRFALLDAFLLARLFATEPPARVQRAVATIVAQEGAVDMGAGSSHRSLGRLFDEWVSMSPKRFSRVIRLQSALRRVQDDPSIDLSRLAIACGYFDHAHLQREMQALAAL